MNLHRLVRILQDRWWVVVAIALLGFLVAAAVTVVIGRSPRDTFDATAAIRFSPQEGQRLVDLEDTLWEAEYIAQQATAPIMPTDGSAVIEVNVVTGRLSFIATDSTEAAAVDTATALREAYFLADPTIGGAVDDLLAELEVEAAGLRAQLAEFAAASDRQDDAILVQNQIDAVTGRLVELTVADAAATTAEQRQLNAAERANLERTLVELRDRLEELTPEGLDVTQSLQVDAINRRLVLLSEEYQRLFLRKLGVAGLGTAEPVTVRESTPPPPNPVVNGMIGLVGALILVVAALIFTDRARRPIWVPSDLPVQLLGHIPARRITAEADTVWYDQPDSGPRKPAVQMLRTAVEAQLPAGSAALAIASHRVPPAAVLALTTDLAASLATAGANVALVNADFTDPVGDGPTLVDALGFSPERGAFAEQLDEMLDRLVPLREGLVTIPSGAAPESPADALAGRQFRWLIEVLLSRFDVVFVHVGDVTAPTAQVAVQRLQHAAIVVSPGTTTAPEFDAVLKDLAQRQVAMFGAILLERRERVLAPVAAGDITRTWAEEHRGDRQEPPRVTPSGPVTSVRVQRPAATPSVPPEDVLDALADATADLPFEAVAGFVVERVVTLLSADDVGIVPFRSFDEHRTVGDLLAEDIRRAAGEAAVDQVREVLATGSAGPVELDDWLAGHFFERHLLRSDGEPVIWHLSSGRGTVQFLVEGTRLDEPVVKDLVARVLPEVMSDIDAEIAAVDESDTDRIQLLQRRHQDVEEFHRGLSDLIDLPTVARKRRSGHLPWEPDWSLGYRANLVAIQQRGLLPFPVLADGEIAAHMASV